MILSWCREKFGSGQGSKVQAVLAGAAFPIVIMIGFIILLMVFGPKGRRPGYDADVKANLKNAATAQEAYFVDHDTYISNIDSLKEHGYLQSINVTIAVEATATTYVITGIATKRCEPDTGIWFISSTTGDINGTQCSRP